MRHLSSNRQYKKDRLETVESEIYDWQSKHYLPRHISAPATTSHRGKHTTDRIDCVPRVCRIDPEKQNQINLAVNILKYQLKDCASQQKHLENVRFSLEHRLEAAKSQGDDRLLDILQEEYRQLETTI